jgi:hypothetical protein
LTETFNWADSTTEPDNFSIGERYLDLRWGKYEYSIELTRLDTPWKTLSFVKHILEKQWEGVTPWRVARLIEELSREGGWELDF